jgi:cytochrome d ubiquinol oxidase subunit II
MSSGRMLANVVLGFLWGGITAYVLLAGADFGAGLWDLLAGSATEGMPRRHRIEESIGPVWEANHVWLIFALVVTWTAFPTVFAAIASTLYIPLTAAAFGVILRGSTFAFRGAVREVSLQRLFGAVFATSSVLTPFFLGTDAGAIASGRVPLGIAQGNIITSWLNPCSILGGVLAVEVSAYLAAVYLTRDCERHHETELALYFQRRALVMGVITGITALAGIGILHADAPRLFDGLTHRGLPLVLASIIFGGLSILLLLRKHFVAVRMTGALAVVAVLWAWGVAQYPDVLSGVVTVSGAAAPDQTLLPLVVALAIGSAILVPSLLLLFTMFQHDVPARSSPASPGSPSG